MQHGADNQAGPDDRDLHSRRAGRSTTGAERKSPFNETQFHLNLWEAVGIW